MNYHYIKKFTRLAGGLSVKRNWMLSLIIITSLLSFFLFIGGFILGIQNVQSTNKSALPSLPTDTEEPVVGQQILGLGDSLTRGIGDTEGKGYINLLKEDLLINDSEVKLTNLAVSGATSTDLLKQLSEKGVIRSVSESNIIMITIGGNDLFRSANLEDIQLSDVDTSQKLYLSNLNSILTSIRNENKDAHIYLLGLYNPFENLEQSELTSKIVYQWNFKTQLLTLDYDNVTFVPVADIFQGNIGKLLYTDHFHPNHEGYRRISNRLLQLIAPNQ